VERDSEINVPMMPCPITNLNISDEYHKRFPRNSIKVVMRRKDLDKEGPEIQAVEGRNDLPPGDWEMQVRSGEEYFPKDVRINNVRVQKRSHDSAEGWVLGTIPISAVPAVIGVPVSVTLSSRVASITGRVMEKTNEPAAYAPVLLETLGLEPPDPQILREARAGADGTFNFKGLPPGKYRLLASFDLDWSDRMAVDTARPVEFTVDQGANVTQDLSLYHKP
jgi:hypothetical protein